MRSNIGCPFFFDIIDIDKLIVVQILKIKLKTSFSNIMINCQMPQNLKKLRNNKFSHLTIILTNVNYHKKISQNNNHF